MGYGSPTVSSGGRGIADGTARRQVAPTGSLPDQFKCRTGCRRRIGELQFFRRERGNNSFLIRPSDHVRERTSLNFGGDDLIRLVDRVCAEVSDRSLHHGLVLLGSPPIAAV